MGVALLLVYALPIFVPPPARTFAPATVDTSALERLFPTVPVWWVVGRLLALLVGAGLIASTCRHLPLRLPLPRPAEHPAEHPDAQRGRLWAALAAAALQLAALPFVRELPYALKSLYVLWIFVPAGILVLPRLPAAWRTWARNHRWAHGSLLTAAVIAGWAGIRLVVSHHSPIAADSVDMFRTLGGLVRLAITDADFTTESMGVTQGVGDIEVVGVNALQLFFEGLPVLKLLGHRPTVYWMQAVNVLWGVVAALIVVAGCQRLVGRRAMATVAAAFLCSPYLLMVQMLPIPSVCVPLSALLVVLPLAIHQSGSPAALVFLGGVAGFTATLPSLTLVTGVALLFVAWTLWAGRRVPAIALAAALCSFVAVATPNLPRPEALQAAYDWYVRKDWPWAVSEPALQGQLSPTEADWTTVDPPGFVVTAAGSLLSPFAVPRNSLRNWGDTLFEPLSAALATVGLLASLRHVRRSRAARFVLAILAAALIPGFVSSYDRTSLTRIYGEMVPLALLAGVGLMIVLRALPARRREWVAHATAVVVAASGLVVFDVVTPRIVSWSTWGLLVRAVDEPWLGRTAFLTASELSLNPPDVEQRFKLWQSDWLRFYHPYIDEIARGVPAQPVAIVDVNKPEELQPYELVFWNPALDQSIRVTERHVCRLWPDATLYTIWDHARISRVHAAQIRGSGWTPDVPPERWTSDRCPAPS